MEYLHLAMPISIRPIESRESSARKREESSSSSDIGDSLSSEDNEKERRDGEEKTITVYGSVIYECVSSGELVLNFYTSSFDSAKKERLDYPQEPIK